MHQDDPHAKEVIERVGPDVRVLQGQGLQMAADAVRSAIKVGPRE